MSLVSKCKVFHLNKDRITKKCSPKFTIVLVSKMDRQVMNIAQ